MKKHKKKQKRSQTAEMFRHILQSKRRILVAVCCMILILNGAYKIISYIGAETIGSSPPIESNATSRIKVISDYLTTKNVGKNVAGTWGDWGVMWNRIYSTAIAGVDYSKQKLATKDDYLGTEQGEESDWTHLAPGTVGSTGLVAGGEIKRDERTGLVWSATSSGTYSNELGTVVDGTPPTGGASVAFCNGLNTAVYGGSNNWYLRT